MTVRVLLLVVAVLFAAPLARAQTKEPIGPFAVDTRVGFPGFKETPEVATAIGVNTTDLPGRGLGLAFGAHWYPARKGAVTLGLGGEIFLSRGSRNRQPTQQGGAEGPAVRTSFSSVAPQLSFNFGARRGWSYISGGIGWVSFTTEVEDKPLPDPESRTSGINYGGGARWFAKKHVALAIDLRFYAISAQEAGRTRPAFPRMTLVVFTAGASFK